MILTCLHRRLDSGRLSDSVLSLAEMYFLLAELASLSLSSRYKMSFASVPSALKRFFATFSRVTDFFFPISTVSQCIVISLAVYLRNKNNMLELFQWIALKLIFHSRSLCSTQGRLSHSSHPVVNKPSLNLISE